MNDNPPELATPYEAAVCEDAKPGQVPLRGWGLGVAARVPSTPAQSGLSLASAPYPLFTLQLIQTISVVDRDEPQGGHRFYFRLVPEAPSNPHFSLLDIQGELPVNHQILGSMERGARGLASPPPSHRGTQRASGGSKMAQKVRARPRGGLAEWRG